MPDLTPDEFAALLSALAGLVPFYGARAAPALRRCLAELLTEPAGGRPLPAPPSGNGVVRADPQEAKSRPPRRSNGASRGEKGDAPRAAARRLSAAAWEKLRHDVQTKMAAEGLDYAHLGAALERTTNTVRVAILRRSPPASALSDLLRTWLNGAAPEVAPTAASFRHQGGGAVRPRA